MMNITVLGVAGGLRVIVIFLNVLGIYCLRKQKQRKDTQKIILYNLSAVELTLQITWSVLQALEQLSGNAKVDQKYRIALACHGGVNLIFYFIMISMTLDRFLRVVLGIRYKYYVTSRTTKRMYLIGWFIALSVSVPILYAIGTERAQKVIYMYGFAVCDSIFMSVALMTYSTIAYLLLASHKKHVKRPKSDSKHCRENNVSFNSDQEKSVNVMLQYRKNVKFFQSKKAIPFLIILSYAILYATPDFTLLYFENKLFMQAATICWSLGFITDPLIYIYVHKPTRNIACNLFYKKLCTKPI